MPLGGLQISAQHACEEAVSFPTFAPASLNITLMLNVPNPNSWVSTPGPWSGLLAPDRQQQVQVLCSRGSEGNRCWREMRIYTSSLSLVMSDGSLTASERTVDSSVRTDSHTASWFQCANLLVLLTDAGILTLVHLVSEGEA